MYLLQQPSDFLPLFQDQQMKSVPGKAFHYNNAAYIVLGLVVEQVTKTAFTNYVTENILEKAEMFSSGYFSMDYLPRNTLLAISRGKTAAIKPTSTPFR